MGKTLYVILATLSSLAVGFAPRAAAQTSPDAQATAPTCRPVTGQAEIDGAMQQISGWACRQPDGTWQIMQDNGGGADLYPATAYPYPYAYYDPWFWGAPVVFGVGASFVFVDRFHHFHPMGHMRFNHPGGVPHSPAASRGGFGGGPRFGGGMMRR